MECRGGRGEAPACGFLRGDESEVESGNGLGKAPVRCVVVVATARQPVEVRIWWYQSVKWSVFVAAALRRDVPHGGGFLGAVRSALVRFSVNAGSLWEVSTFD